MKCEACGYDTRCYDKEYYGPPSDPFIELIVVERGPFFSGTPDVWPTGGSIPAIKRGTPVKMLACPRCGTVRIEV